MRGLPVFVRPHTPPHRQAPPAMHRRRSRRALLLARVRSFKYCLLRFRRFCNSSSDSSDAAPSWAWPLAAHEEKEHVDACRRCSALWARRDFLRAPTAHNVARCRPCEHRDHLQCPRRPDRSSPCSWPSQPWKPCPTRSDQRVPSQFRVVVVPTACAVDGVGGSLLDGSTRNSETDRTAEERKREKRVRRVSRYRSAGLRKSDSLSQILTHPRLDPDDLGVGLNSHLYSQSHSRSPWSHHSLTVTLSTHHAVRPWASSAASRSV